VFDVDAPSTFLRDVPCDDPRGLIRPTDGALIYWCFDKDLYKEVIRQFVPDNSTSKAKPASNDIDIDLPACMLGKPTFPSYDWWMAPDTGQILFVCDYGDAYSSGYTKSYAYTDGTSFTLSGLNDILAIGYGGVFFARNAATPPPYFFIVSQDGTRIPVAEGPYVGAYTDITAVRATTTGFMLLQVDTFNNYKMTRWQVAFDGSVTEQLVYPPEPPPFVDDQYPSHSALDSQGRALAFVGTPRFVILRYDPSAAVADVVYDRTQYPDHKDFTGYGGFYTGP
jgi:hypothetical protein